MTRASSSVANLRNREQRQVSEEWMRIMMMMMLHVVNTSCKNHCGLFLFLFDILVEQLAELRSIVYYLELSKSIQIS